MKPYVICAQSIVEAKSPAHKPALRPLNGKTDLSQCSWSGNGPYRHYQISRYSSAAGAKADDASSSFASSQFDPLQKSA